MSERVFPWWSRWYYRLFGSNKLRPYEQLCVDAWRQSLSSRDRIVLGTQIGTVDLVTRRGGGAMVYLYQVYERKDPRAQSLPFPLKAPTCHVADVILTTESKSAGKIMAVKIFLHRGRFWAMQFPERPNRSLRAHTGKKASVRATKVVATRALA